MPIARILLLVLACGIVTACGGGARPGVRSPSGGDPVAADPALTLDCPAACARLRECGASPSATCESDCKAASADDTGRSRWACWSSSQTCLEMTECDAVAE